jgi:APA family basic amino acid/polyamine antiporter
MSRTEREARRPLGVWPATALVVGHTIGVGIFLTPAELIGALASPALTFGVWLGVGALALFGALAYGELASRYPQAGGVYVYLREAWGEEVAFLYGWQCLLVMDPGVTAGLAAGSGGYAAVLWPSAAGSARWVALAIIWILALLSMAGLRLSVRTIEILTVAKLLLFAGVIVLAFTAGAGDPTHFSPFLHRRAGAPPLFQALGLGLVGAFFSFGGFWEAARVADEVRDPVRTLPRALALGVVIVTLVYVATTAAFLYLVPSSAALDAETFTRAAGEGLLGSKGPQLLAAAVLLSAVASAAALIFLAPRMYVAMARDRAFPAPLAALHPTTGAPVRATALLAGLASLLVWLGSFRQIAAFFLCTSLGFLALAAAGLFVVRRRATAVPAYRTPGHPASTMLFVALLAVVVLLVAVTNPRQAIAGAVLVALGIPAYRLLRRSGRVAS